MYPGSEPFSPIPTINRFVHPRPSSATSPFVTDTPLPSLAFPTAYTTPPSPLLTPFHFNSSPSPTLAPFTSSDPEGPSLDHKPSSSSNITCRRGIPILGDFKRSHDFCSRMDFESDEPQEEYYWDF